jgi:S-adenosylmethionine hydrolase
LTSHERDRSERRCSVSRNVTRVTSARTAFGGRDVIAVTAAELVVNAVL